MGERYYVPYLGFRAVGEWFDALGKILAILSGVADESRTETVLDFIDRYRLGQAPTQSLTPVVEPGHPDWRDYYGVHNQPYHHHNGGIWPFIGGFYVAGLVRARRLKDAERALDRLTVLNRAGEFHEWHHGESCQPMGATAQAWSAGMYLFACECVSRSEVPEGFFGIDGGPG